MHPDQDQPPGFLGLHRGELGPIHSGNDDISCLPGLAADVVLTALNGLCESPAAIPIPTGVPQVGSRASLHLLVSHLVHRKDIYRGAQGAHVD